MQYCGDSLEEVLDDGTDLLVMGDSIEEINEYIDSALVSEDEDGLDIVEDKNEIILGYYVKADEVDFLDNISESDLATLQKSTSVGNSFVGKICMLKI